MIQAQKSLEAASYACNDGGTIILLAECGDGLGRPDFLKWFDAASSDELAIRLCERYEVNGQTAWSLLKKTERFAINILTSLNELETSKMGMSKIDLIQNGTGNGYIIPIGAKILISLG